MITLPRTLRIPALPTLLAVMGASTAHALSPAAPPPATVNGEIYVLVQTEPNGATDQFTFTHNVGSNSSPAVASPFLMRDGRVEVFSSVAPGVYTFTQTLPSEWELVAAGDGYETGCWDEQNNSIIDVTTGVATVNVAAGEFIVCTFVNRRRGIPEPPASAVSQTLSSPRGIGYWRHWAGCITEADVSSRDAALARRALRISSGTYPIGNVTTMNCQQLFWMLSMRDFAGLIKANDAAYNLAAHHLAAKLNRTAGAPVPACVEAAINAAQQLLVNLGFNATGSYLGPGSSPVARNEALELAGLLGRYNDADATVLAGSCG